MVLSSKFKLSDLHRLEHCVALCFTLPASSDARTIPSVSAPLLLDKAAWWLSQSVDGFVAQNHRSMMARCSSTHPSHAPIARPSHPIAPHRNLKSLTLQGCGVDLELGIGSLWIIHPPSCDMMMLMTMVPCRQQQRKERWDGPIESAFARGCEGGLPS